jgi:DNA-binding transcriptional LysR family regulator
MISIMEIELSEATAMADEFTESQADAPAVDTTAAETLRVADTTPIGVSLGGPVLETDLLRTLIAIVTTGSFARAAQAVYRTPSAVSMQMKRLEDMVGRPLFVKDGRGVTLTADGEDLLGYARRMVQLSDEALARFRCRDTRGTVRLGTPDDYATRFLPPILARFAASHPMVQVDVNCQPSRILADMLAENAVDIALTSVGVNCGVPGTGTIVHRETLVWATLRHGSAHMRRPLPLAVSGQTCSWRSLALERLDRAGVTYRIAYSSAHYVGQIAPVLAGLAVAPIPKSIIDGNLMAVEDGSLPPLGFYEIQLLRAPRATGAAIDALAGHIEASFSAESQAA